MLAAAPPVIDPSDPAAVVELKRQLQFAHLKIQLLEERLRLERIQKYGPASEKLNDAQLELLDEEPGVSRLEVIAESEREPLPAAAPMQPRRIRRHPDGRHSPRIWRGSNALSLARPNSPAARTVASRPKSSATSRANNWM